MSSDDLGKATSRKIRRRRVSSCMPSCFTASAVSGDEDGYCGPATCTASKKPRRPFSWRRFKAKKKTVPVTENHHELPTESNQDIIPRSSTEDIQKQADPNPNPNPNVTLKKSCIFQQISSKCNQTPQPSNQHHRLDSSHISTTTSHHGSPSRTSTSSNYPSKKCEVIALASGKLDLDAGLIVLAMTLVALLLFGRASAVICVSVWFYIVPRLRAATKSAPGSEKKKMKAADSGELRKRVVMQGLLERNGKRPSGFF